MLAQEVRELERENILLKEAVETMRRQFDSEPEKPKACAYCKFYIQHWVKVDGHYKETHCGHCTHGRCKERKPKDSCKYFELGTYDIKHFA